MNERLANEKVSKLLTSLAIPAVLAQIVTLLYNMVDRIYIGHIANGAMAMAGIGLCVSVITIITAVTNLFGRGGAPLASIRLGEGDTEGGSKIISAAFSCMVIVSLCITAVLLAFGDDILRIFGASENTLPYAHKYLSIYAVGTVFVQISVGMNYFINCQGFAKFGMVTILIGGLLNIVLDPIFIFYFDMGVSGAALATVLSQMVSCAWVLSFLLGKRSVLRIRAKYLIPKTKTLKGILSLGLSPFFMHSTEGILLMCFNRQLLKFGGDIAVSAMTVLTAMAQILFLVMEGIAQGSQPIISFNYGADKLERVRATIKLSALASLIYGAVLSIAMELAPEIFVRIFAEDRELIALAARLLRVYIAGYIIIGANCTIQQAYTSLGCGKRAFFFAFYRKIILLIPLIYILPHFISNGVFAVILAEPVSDILTTCTNVVFFSRFFKKSLTENS